LDILKGIFEAIFHLDGIFQSAKNIN